MGTHKKRPVIPQILPQRARDNIMIKPLKLTVFPRDPFGVVRCKGTKIQESRLRKKIKPSKLVSWVEPDKKTPSDSAMIAPVISETERK